MPANYRPPLPQWNGNLLCSVDIETSGTDPEQHGILQIAIVPLDFDYTPLKTIPAFRTYVQPTGEMDPGAMAKNGLSETALANAPSASGLSTT